MVIFEVTSKDVADSVNKFYMYVEEQVVKPLNKQRVQAGVLINGEINATKNYIENSLQFLENSKNQVDYFNQYLKSTAGQIFQGLNNNFKTAESN